MNTQTLPGRRYRERTRIVARSTRFHHAEPNTQRDAIRTGGQVAGAAAGTAIAPVIGTAVGAALGGIIADLFGGRGTWSEAGPGVHDWWTRYGEEPVLAWVRANAPESFATLDATRAARMLYYWQKGTILHPTDDPQYFPEGTVEGARKFYASIGVDYPATVAKIASAPQGWHGNVTPDEIVMLPGAGAPTIPQAAVDAAKDAADRVARGEGTTGDLNLMNILNNAAGDLAREAARGASQGLNEGGGVAVNIDLKSLLPWILGGLLALAAIIYFTRKG